MANGVVYTLRKPKKNLGRHSAVVNSLFETPFAIVNVELEKKNITNAQELEPYVALSGFDDAKTWLWEAIKLNGMNLNLYKVTKLYPKKA
jgi:hypothetical protein